MKKKVKSKKSYWNFKNIFLGFLMVIGIILIFAAIDYFFHSLSSEYSVPPRYFPNKIIYGTIIGFVSYLFLINKRPLIKSLIFSAVVSILLQIRYLIEGYSLNFVILFLFIHFAILVVISWIFFRLIEKYL